MRGAVRGARDRERREGGPGIVHLETHARGRPQGGQHLLITYPAA